MGYPRTYNYLGVKAIIEPTSEVSSTVWIRNRNDRFYSMRRIGKHWHVSAHEAENGVSTGDPRYLGWRDLKSWAIHLCITDFLKK